MFDRIRKMRNDFVHAKRRAFERFHFGPNRQTIIDRFHCLYYNSWFYQGTVPQDNFELRWLGTCVVKCPLDLWMYQEIMFEIRPDLIIETGTNEGGSAAYFASILDLMGIEGKILTIDIVDDGNRPVHDRITYLKGSSTSPQIAQTVQEMAATAKTVMVCLDSDHSRDHVLRELEIFSNIVTVGSYLIVEDTNVNGHPAFPKHGPGPMEAVREFLKRDSRYTVDTKRERLMLTMNPNGYLKRIS